MQGNQFYSFKSKKRLKTRKEVVIMANNVEIKNKLLEETCKLVRQLYYKFYEDEYFISQEYDRALKVGTPDEIHEVERDRDYWEGECKRLQDELTAVKEHVQSLEKAIIKKNKIIDKLTKE